MGICNAYSIRGTHACLLIYRQDCEFVRPATEHLVLRYRVGYGLASKAPYCADLKQSVQTSPDSNSLVERVTEHLQVLVRKAEVIFAQCYVGNTQFFLPQNAPAHSEVPPVAAEGDTSQEVPRKAEKTHEAPFATQSTAWCAKSC